MFYIAWLTLLLVGPAGWSEELNPLNISKTNLRYSLLPSPTLSAPALDRNVALGDTHGVALEMEAPIYPWLLGGFLFEVQSGFSNLNPRTIYESNSSKKDFTLSDPPFFKEALPNLTMGIGLFLKPYWQIPISSQWLSLYSRIPLGFGLMTSGPAISLFTDNDILTDAPPASTNQAYVFHTGANIGIEYFPTWVLGFYAEAGYDIQYHLFPILYRHKIQTGPGSFETRPSSTGARGYFVHGTQLSFGIRITY